MTIVITKGDYPGNYIYVDVNADFATLVTTSFISTNFL